jgi:hypothetical protein
MDNLAAATATAAAASTAATIATTVASAAAMTMPTVLAATAIVAAGTFAAAIAGGAFACWFFFTYRLGLAARCFARLVAAGMAAMVTLAMATAAATKRVGLRFQTNHYNGQGRQT